MRRLAALLALAPALDATYAASAAVPAAWPPRPYRPAAAETVRFPYS